MSRLVGVMLGFAVGLSATACDDGGSTPSAARTDQPSTTAVESTRATSTTSAASQPDSRCPPTPFEAPAETAILTLGPAPGVPASTSRSGEALVITGTVYDGSCLPVPGTRIHVWQTDGDGRYGPGHGTDDLECCYLQGTVRTDTDGRYRLITTMPGHYAGESSPPPAHIHVEVTPPGGETVMTEILFAGDPYLPEDPGPGPVVVDLAVDPETADTTLVGVADLVVHP